MAALEFFRGRCKIAFFLLFFEKRGRFFYMEEQNLNSLFFKKEGATVRACTYAATATGYKLIHIFNTSVNLQIVNNQHIIRGHQEAEKHLKKHHY